MKSWSNLLITGKAALSWLSMSKESINPISPAQMPMDWPNLDGLKSSWSSPHFWYWANKVWCPRRSKSLSIMSSWIRSDEWNISIAAAASSTASSIEWRYIRYVRRTSFPRSIFPEQTKSLSLLQRSAPQELIRERSALFSLRNLPILARIASWCSGRKSTMFNSLHSNIYSIE